MGFRGGQGEGLTFLSLRSLEETLNPKPSISLAWQGHLDARICRLGENPEP